MKLAAYQAPLPQDDLEAAIADIAQRVRICEAEGVDLLCCPEAVVGGLATTTRSRRASRCRSRGWKRSCVRWRAGP